MALEEMFTVEVLQGALFYGETRRRITVSFDTALRQLTKETAENVRAMIACGNTPAPIYERRKCEACSLLEICRPKAIARKRNVAEWRSAAIEG
jgi:CRISPR-associated exonuclease Cas4